MPGGRSSCSAWLVPGSWEERSAWSAGALFLEPLDTSDIEHLVTGRADTMPLPALLGGIVGAAQGNPLFAEQLLAAFREGGFETVPASLRSLLVMRLDRLGPGERDLLRSAAVVGADVAEEALMALVPEHARPFVERHLQALQIKDFIARNDAGLGFRHALIRQAAYQSLTRNDRARLHERFADWLENEASEPPPELDEIAGYHLQQAVEHRRAIGLEDGTLAQRAGERLANAGERAMWRGDLTAAHRLLSIARSMLPSDHPRRLVVTQRLAEVCLPVGQHRQALELLGEIIEAARASGDRSSELYALLERARVQLLIGPDPLPLEAFRREAEEAFAHFTGTGDDTGLAQAAFLTGFVEERAGRMAAMEDGYRTSLSLADRSGQMREMLAARWMLAHALVLGPVPAPECIEQCQELLSFQGIEVPGVRMALGLFTAMAGRFDEAREMADRAWWVIEEQMRVKRLLKFIAASRGMLEQLAGDMSTAERQFRASLEIDRAIGGERDDLSQAAARLALVLWRQGRAEEAEELTALSVRVAPSESVAAQALSCAARARATADAEPALRAAELVPPEMLNLRADVLIELAAVLRENGNDVAARGALEEAAELYERKGNLAAIAGIVP